MYSFLLINYGTRRIKMSKIRLSFCAEREEIFNLVEESMFAFDLNTIAIKLFSFEQETISLQKIKDKMEFVTDSKMLFLCKTVPKELSTIYWEFVNQNRDSLVIYLGDQKDNCLQESSIGT